MYFCFYNCIGTFSFQSRILYNSYLYFIIARVQNGLLSKPAFLCHNGFIGLLSARLFFFNLATLSFLVGVTLSSFLSKFYTVCEKFINNLRWYTLQMSIWPDWIFHISYFFISKNKFFDIIKFNFDIKN